MVTKSARTYQKNEKVVIKKTAFYNTRYLLWSIYAPHGAGRIMKREDIKNHFTVSSFKSEMKGIYSSCINKDTLDEAPFAYRAIDEITEVIKDTVTIDKIIKPVYNFKAGNGR